MTELNQRKKETAQILDQTVISDLTVADEALFTARQQRKSGQQSSALTSRDDLRAKETVGTETGWTFREDTETDKELTKRIADISLYPVANDVDADSLEGA